MWGFCLVCRYLSNLQLYQVRGLNSLMNPPKNITLRNSYSTKLCFLLVQFFVPNTKMPSLLQFSARIILFSAATKEYILVRERTAPPCVFRTFAHPTSPCSVCSILQLPDCLTEQAAGEVGWANVWKTQGGSVRSLTDIYSLI